MAEARSATLNARIVYWGVPGAGLSSCLRTIQAKLRGGGTLRELPTRLDPGVVYEILPISLGEVNGFATEIEVVAVPGAASHATTRKQLLDRADGVVFVADATPGRLEENKRCLAELAETLSAYGRSMADLPIVLQYNKRDLADPYGIEELHRSIEIPGAAVFESIATEGTGVLQALTTISKRAMRIRRDQIARARESAVDEQPSVEGIAAIEAKPLIEAVAPAPLERATHPLSLEAAILAEEADLTEADATAQAAFDAAALFDRPFEELVREAKFEGSARIGRDFEIVSIGSATRAGPRAVRVPLVLGNPEGETVSMALSIALDPVIDDAEE